MIIIEGMDNSGKTTLGETLAAHFDWPLIHSPGYGPEMVNWAMSTLLVKAPRIYDRHPCISERVYGPVLRNRVEFNSRRGEAVIERFIEENPLIIYCKPPDSVITKDLKGQMEGIESNALTLIMTYNRLMAYLSDMGFLVIKYDFTEHGEIAWENLLAVVAYTERERRISSGKYKRF